MDLLNILMAVVSIVLGIISIIIAIRSQAETNKINKDTEMKLLEIKNLNDNISKTADRIESNAPTQDEKMQRDLLTTILPAMVSNPEMLSKLIEMGNKGEMKK